MFKREKPYNHYSYFQTLWLSFYSPNIYVDAAKRWSGIGAAYLLLLSCIFAMPLSVQFIQKIKTYFPSSLDIAVKNMPTLVIHDKKMRFEPNPAAGITRDTTVWIWPTHPSAQHPYPDIVINLPRKTESFGALFIPILITQDFIQIQTFSPFGGRPVKDKLTISKEEGGIIGSKEVGRFVNQIKRNFIMTTYPYLLWLMWAFLLSFVIFFAPFINVLYYVRYRKKLLWRQSARILCVAAAPGLLSLEILYFLNAFTKKWMLISLFISVIYYFFGSRACMLDQEPLRR